MPGQALPAARPPAPPPGRAAAPSTGPATPLPDRDLGSDGLPGTRKAGARMTARRGDGENVRLQAVPGEDVVVLRLVDGPTLVLHPQHARALLRAQAPAPRAEGQTVPAADAAARPLAAGRTAAASLQPARGPRGRGAGASPTDAAAVPPPLGADYRPADGTGTGNGNGTGVDDDDDDGSDVAVPARLEWQALTATGTGADAPAGPARGLRRGGLGGLLVSAVEIVTGLGRDRAVKFVASQVVQRVDGQVEAGVYALSRESLTALKGSGRRLPAVPAPAQPPAPSRVEPPPILVLVHGTFVDTVSTFGPLWSRHAPLVDGLFRFYGERVWALDHPTIGASPLANALTLVQALPAGARLHLLTHSRGGLVAEALARVAGLDGDLPDADAAWFADPAWRTMDAERRELVRAVRAKGIRVERVVRVACPARGTLLASKRLDAYLSVLQWTLKLAGVPVAPALLDFLAEVARRRARPDELPGLAAMVPDTPFVDWLAAAPQPVPGELRVIAGDLQGDSVGTWLKTLVADAFYWGDNDLVVHTAAMYGGAPRRGGAQFLLDQGGTVTHFGYFAQPRTAEAMARALQDDDPEGFRPIGPLSWAGRAADGLRGLRAHGDPQALAQRPAVFLLPGICGSHLRDGDERIWLSLRLVGGLHRLAWREGVDDGVRDDGVIGRVYDALVDHLSASHEVIAFGFDWRRPLEDEAQRLADRIEAELDRRADSGQPVRLLAHSMGGVLARTVQIVRPETFARLMQRDGARLLMLGTPNGGSWAPMQVLSGDDTFGNTLAALGSPLRQRQARQWMAEMPGLLQLQAGLMDDALGLARAGRWAQLAQEDVQRLQQASWWHRSEGQAQQAIHAWGLPPQPVLDRALALRERLDAQLRDPQWGVFAARMLLVAGRAPFTPDGIGFGDEGMVYLDASAGGDGRVPLASAQLPGVPAWQLDVDHGSLPEAREHFDTFVELLRTGHTDRLPRVPARASGAAAPASRAAGPRWPLPPARPPRDGEAGGNGADSDGPFRASARLPDRARDALPPAGDAQAAALPPAAQRPSRRRGGLLPAQAERDAFGLPAPADAGDEAGTAQAMALQVEVLNGNLTFVSQPLLVGHSRSLVLTGTEKAVNAIVGGALQASLDTGLYPDAPGTHQIFLNDRRDPDNPWRDPQPGGVVIVGLGEEGQLTEQQLTHSVRQATLAWAQRVGEGSAGEALRRDAPTTIELAATLMGSGGIGMNPGGVARAIAQGVHEANERLRRQPRQKAAGGGTPPVRLPVVTRLTLVELYLERAADAWNGLKVLAESAPGRFRVEPVIATGTGPLRRQIDSGYRGTDYDFIAVTASGAQTLQFTLDTRRARTEVRAQSTQGALLRQLVAQASNADVRDPRLGRTLFQLLVPVEVEPFLSGNSRVLLELDDATAPIPWEMLDSPAEARAGADARPWSIRTRLLRKLRTERYRQQVQDASRDDAVLVIGEPLADPGVYPPLPGALEEAQTVAKAFRSDGGIAPERVVELMGADASAVINTLMQRRYRIVHIAGHGEPVQPGEDGQPARPGGVVLSDDTFISADEIRSMRTVPELVFVNCCHLGRHEPSPGTVGPTAGAMPLPAVGRASTARSPAVPFAAGTPGARSSAGPRPPRAGLHAATGQRAAARAADPDPRAPVRGAAFNRPEFASAVADSLIEIGVRCVVAAGWAVDDGPAKVFAERFYRALLARQPFVNAVGIAREAAWEAAPDSNTWAAYQCYGDPNWTFRPDDAAATVVDSPAEEYANVASPLGVALALEDVAVKARWMHEKPQTQHAKVRFLDQRFGARWGAIGAVAEAFGLAHAETGDLDAALAWYRRAVLCNDGSASMRAHEQLANLQAQQAWERLTAPSPRLRPPSRPSPAPRGPAAARTPARDAAAPADGPAARQQTQARLQARRGIDAALRILQPLVKTAPTSERWSLIGSAHKRLALVEQEAGRRAPAARALHDSLAAYSRALELAVASGDAGRHYPWLNVIALRLRLRQLPAGPRPLPPLDIAQALDRLRMLLRERLERAPSFEIHTALVEVDALQAVADGRLHEALDGLRQRLADVHARVSSPKAWTSAADQADLLFGSPPPGLPRAEADAGQALRRLLRDYAEDRPAAPPQHPAAP